jgi:hypothetical protein
MQKRLVIGLALALSVAPLAARADAPHTTPLIGTPCDATQVGMTRMDTDQKNIIACLKTDSGNSVWKAMSGASSSGRQCSASLGGLWSPYNEGGEVGLPGNFASEETCVFSDGTFCATALATNGWKCRKPSGWVPGSDTNSMQCSAITYGDYSTSTQCAFSDGTLCVLNYWGGNSNPDWACAQLTGWPVTTKSP